MSPLRSKPRNARTRSAGKALNGQTPADEKVAELAKKQQQLADEAARTRPARTSRRSRTFRSVRANWLANWTSANPRPRPPKPMPRTLPRKPDQMRTSPMSFPQDQGSRRQAGSTSTTRQCQEAARRRAGSSCEEAEGQRGGGSESGGDQAFTSEARKKATQNRGVEEPMSCQDARRRSSSAGRSSTSG